MIESVQIFILNKIIIILTHSIWGCQPIIVYENFECNKEKWTLFENSLIIFRRL